MMYRNYEDFMTSRYKDIYGNPVKRTPHEYPYSYDAYVTYKKRDVSGDTEVVYSDRMKQWNWGKFEKCHKEAFNGIHSPFSNSALTEKFLQLYFDSPNLELIAVMTGANQSSGYPYWVFYFERNETKNK